MPKMLTKQDKVAIRDIVVEVIKDVVMPAFETVALKTDMETRFGGVENRLDRMETRLDSMEARLDSMDRKLDIFSAKTLDHDQKLSKHDKRIESLEALTTRS